MMEEEGAIVELSLDDYMGYMLALSYISVGQQVTVMFPCLCLFKISYFSFYCDFLYQINLCFYYFWKFVLGSWRSVSSLHLRSEL
jgi:hypothetical protein